MKEKFLLLYCLFVGFFVHSADVYWVGGSGNWRDIQHWATTSGGSSQPLTIPTENDNVFFDGNSNLPNSTTFTVTVELNEASCKNLTLNYSHAIPRFVNVNSVALNIYGDLNIVTNCIWDINKVNFKGSGTNKIINFRNVTSAIPADFNFVDPGSWKLGNDISLSSLVISAGNFDTDGKNLNLANFRTTNNTNSKNIYLRNSLVVISGSLAFQGSNTHLHKGTSHVVFTRLFTGGFTNDNGLPSTLTGIANSSTNPTLSFYHVSTTDTSSTNFTIASNTSFQKFVPAGGFRTLGDILCDTIIVSPGSIVNLNGGSILTVNKYFKAVSTNCGVFTQIMAPSLSTIKFNTGCVIDINGVQFSNTKGEVVGGSGPIPALNTYNLGNSTGFNFSTSPVGKKLYWIGGVGNWGDVRNWSTNPSVIVANSCVPSIFDTVVFINSAIKRTGSTIDVKLNKITNTCKEMYWEGSFPANTIISGNAGLNNLYIAGSLKLAANVQYYVGDTYLTSPINSTITINQAIIGNGSAIYKGNFIIEAGWNAATNSYGSYTLLDDLKIGTTRAIGSFRIDRGGFNSGGNKIDVAFFIVISNHDKIINISNSNIYCRGNIFSWTMTGLVNTFISTNSNIYMDDVAPGFRPGNNVYHNVLFTNSASTLSSDRIVTGDFRANKIVFNGNATIKSSFITDSLFLGASIRFDLDKDITINKYVHSRSEDCESMTRIYGINTQKKVNLLASTILDLSGIEFKNIWLSGPVVGYSIPNSFNANNNQNITFNNRQGKTFYWIGNRSASTSSGSWNVSTNWEVNTNAISTGINGLGFVNTHGCLPTQVDNVVFNNLSFIGMNHTVLLDQTSQFCNNMTWETATNSPILRSTLEENSLNVSGEFILNSIMKYQVSYTNFTAISAVDLNTKGIVIHPALGSNVVQFLFEGSGTWNLRNDLKLNEFYFVTGAALKGDIVFKEGSLNTNNYNVNIINLFSSENRTRNLRLGSSKITMYGDYSAWKYIGSNAVLVSSTSHIEFIRGIASSNVNEFIFLEGNSGHKYYNVSFTKPVVNHAEVKGGVLINKLLFKGNGRFIKSNTMDTLILNSGKNYLLEINETQKVLEEFIPNGTPCGNVFINSTSAGYRAKLSILDGNYNYDYVTIKDIDASGSYQTLKFGPKSIGDINVNSTYNNVNMSFVPYLTGSIDGLGGSRTLDRCTGVDTILLRTDLFYPTSNTSYTWYKVPSNVILSHADTFVVRPFQNGTYKAVANFGDDCIVESSALVTIVNCPTALPVELVSFEVAANECSNQIIWSTGSEVNNKGFEIYRIYNEDTVLVKAVEGRGNSSILNSYSIIDENIESNKLYYYYLKQIDFNGRSEVFELKSVLSGNCLNSVIVYPNPTNGLINFKFSSISSTVDYNLVDLTGKIVMQGMVDANMSIDISDLSKGVYIVELNDHYDLKETIRIVKN